MLETIAGQDERDSTAFDYQKEDYINLLSKDIKGMKVGVVKEFFQEGLDQEVDKITKEAIKSLEKMGAKVQEVSLPTTHYSLATYYILMPAEASSNLARYDGIRYGLNSQQAKDLISQYRETRAKGFGEEVRRRIMLGTYSLSSGYYDQYYIKAKKVQKAIRKEYQQVFSKFDCLIGPTTPTTAFALGEKVDDPLAMYLSDIYTVAANITGLPAISLPVGLSQNLPVGVQLMADMFQEGKMLNLAYHLEKSMDFKPEPPL